MNTRIRVVIVCLMVAGGCGKQPTGESRPNVDTSVAELEPNSSNTPSKAKVTSLESTPVWIESLGGRVRWEQGKITQLDLRDCPVKDDHMPRISELTSLKVLKLNGKHTEASVSPESFSALATLTNLKVLALDLLPVTDAGLAPLAPLNNLVELYLAKTDLGDPSAETIAKFTKLKKLRLAGNSIGPTSFASLVTLEELVELDVSECDGFDDQAAGMLAELPKLQKINLWRTGITDQACPALSECKTLVSLNVDATKVGDAGLDSIGKMKPLTFLHLGSTQITDEGLPPIAGLKSLEKLIVTRTAVTQAGVDKLKPLLPDTEIQLEYQAP